MGFNVPQCPQFLEKQVCKIFIIRNYQIPSTFRHISLSVELIAPIKPGFNRIELLCHFFFPPETLSRQYSVQNSRSLQNRYIFPKHCLKKIPANQLKENSFKHKISFKKKILDSSGNQVPITKLK